MGGQVTGTPERLSPWPGHRALAATCLLSARVPGLTGGGMGPRWAGLEDRVRARCHHLAPENPRSILPASASLVAAGAPVRTLSRQAVAFQFWLNHFRRKPFI